MSQKIYKPIFIIGTGRSGTTSLYTLFSCHSDLAWFSTLTDRFPKLPRLAKFSSWLDIPVLGKLLRNKKVGPRPEEAYNIWRLCFPGFVSPIRPLTEEDVTNQAKSSIRRMIELHLTYQGKSRFVTKYTGWSRIRYLNEIFPDSLFIHVLRDGRAVANSLLNVSWWNGWEGPDNWLWGKLPSEWEKEWEESNRSFIVLAAIQWKLLIQEIYDGKKILDKNRFLEIRYEDIVDNPIKILRSVTEFCELHWHKEFESHINTSRLKNMNYKWERDLTPHQKELLNSCLYDFLKKLRYIEDTQTQIAIKK